MSYTLNEAQKLRNYYTNELIGKYFDDEKKYKIAEIEINLIKSSENRYEVRAKTAQTRLDINSAAVLFEEIENAAKRFNLLSPKKVLSTKED